MKAKLFGSDGKEKKDIELPIQFSEPVREDIILRAVVSIRTHKRQPYGAKLNAGKIHSVDFRKRRRVFRTLYGRGASRTPRKVMNRRGTQFYTIGAGVPQTRGGRRAHPPKAMKIWEEAINNKERKKAIRSAIAATANPDYVSKRNHKFKNLPIIFDSSLESIKNLKDFMKFVHGVGIEEDLAKAKNITVRAGKGKSRGRLYKKKKSFLIVLGDKSKLGILVSNLPGVDVIGVKNLNAEILAPGGSPGRLTLWSEKAIEALKKDKLFM